MMENRSKSFLLLGCLACVIGVGTVRAAPVTSTATTQTTTQTVNMPSPVGRWQTIDDVTQKPRSIVELSMVNGYLTGKIIKVDYRPGEGPNDICTKCSGDLHDQKFLGLTILTHMLQDPGNTLQWVGGTIVDPESGKGYDCKITLSQDGKTLKVRGFIGFSLLGRTQNWYRVSGA